MPGILPVIGRTLAEASAKLIELDQWTPIASAMPLLEERFGHSLAAYDLDGPLPDLPVSDQLSSHAELLTALARREDLIIRQLAHARRIRPDLGASLTSAFEKLLDPPRWLQGAQSRMSGFEGGVAA